MSPELTHLHDILQQGLRRSMQGSYERRAPAKEALPYLRDARAGLRKYLSENAQDAEAWKLLALAEECLLNYTAARKSLERSMSLAGKKDKRELKRLANLRECEAKWSRFMLNPEQLRNLGLYLDEKLKGQPCDHTTALTTEWLGLHVKGNHSKMLEAFRTCGGYCDCEILANVVAG